MDAVKCKFCDKEFRNNKACNRHIRNIHKRTAKGEIILEEKSKFSCGVCNKQFIQKYSLQRHINVMHPLNNDNIHKCSVCSFTTIHKDNLKRHESKMHGDNNREESLKPVYMCSQCSSKYNCLRNLRFHERKRHKIGTPIVGKRVCPICRFIAVARSKEVIYKHFENSHQIMLNWEHHKFPSLHDFHAWKTEVEKNTTTFYSKRQETSKSIVYHCHRYGTYKKTGRNIRSARRLGSCKINGFCPATIKVQIENTEVNVFYLPVHIGHKNEQRYIHLPTERSTIEAGQLPSLTSPNTLTGIWESPSKYYSRKIQVSNKKQSSGIEYNLNFSKKAVTHPFDPLSTEEWVNTQKSSNDTALIVYKPQGVVSEAFPQLNKDDFLLIYMSEAQRQLLQKYSDDTICIDATQSPNSSNFQLFTLLALDEIKEGFPAAFMFTNRGDESTLMTFFNKIKIVTGEIKPNILMSGIEESFYSAWEKTMGSANTLKMFCTQYVLKTWKDNVNVKIKNKEKRDTVYQILLTLMYELDIDVFNNLLEATVVRLYSDEDLCLFYEYFDKYFVKEERYKYWAYCFRIIAGVATTTSLQNFNKVLSYCYLRGKTVKRLDKTINVILYLLKEKLLDLILKMQKGKVVRKLELLRRRHVLSFLIDSSQVMKLENKWQVLTTEDEQVIGYVVKRTRICNICQLQCLQCNSCFHEFVCSCADSSIRNNMCKHIHLVARTINGNENQFSEVETEEVVHVIDIDDNDDDVAEQCALNEMSGNQDQCYVNEQKEKLLLECCEFKTYVHNNVKTLQQINYVRNKFKEIMMNIDALDAC